MFAQLDPGESLVFQTAYVIGDGQIGFRQNAINAQRVFNGRYIDADGEPLGQTSQAEEHDDIERQLTTYAEDVAREFELLEGADPNPVGFGLTFIDHLTHNVYFGNMDEWAAFYERLFGFYEVRYFDIKGQQTGLKSKAMTSPNGAISIPINQSEDPKSQINEYLDEYKGEGVQHIALYTENIYDTVEGLRAEGIEFLDTPDTYYEIIDRREHRYRLPPRQPGQPGHPSLSALPSAPRESFCNQR